MNAYLAKNDPCHEWLHLVNSYNKYVEKSSVVLEIGASTPSRTSVLSEKCDTFFGVELMPERLPDNFDNVKYMEADWEKLSDFFEDNYFDIIISNHVIEHVPDDQKAMEELYKVLKPNGIALFNTPNRKRMTRAVIEVFKGERKFPFWEHQREYIESDLISLIEKSPFEKYEIHPVVFGLTGGPLHIYSTRVPDLFRKYAASWEIHLYK